MADNSMTTEIETGTETRTTTAIYKRKDLPISLISLTLHTNPTNLTNATTILQATTSMVRERRCMECVEAEVVTEKITVPIAMDRDGITKILIMTMVDRKGQLTLVLPEDTMTQKAV